MAARRLHHWFKFISAIVISIGWTVSSFGQAASNTLSLSSPAEAERMARVEQNVPAVEIKGQAPIKMTLQQWMEALKIPGLSVAVFDHGKIMWAKTYGVKEEIPWKSCQSVGANAACESRLQELVATAARMVVGLRSGASRA